MRKHTIMKKLGFNAIAAITFLFICSFVPPPIENEVEEGLVKWYTWEEAMEQMKVEKKKIFVDLYTDWCGWCKRMDKQTFQKAQIAEYLNENFYPIKFDGEHKETITIGNKEYKFVKNGRRGYHELAVAITGGNLRYPTVVFINENLDVIQPIPGFQNADRFEVMMTYFGGNHYQNTPWLAYERKYRAQKKINEASKGGQLAGDKKN